jgi:hypothetical protein
MVDSMVGLKVVMKALTMVDLMAVLMAEKMDVN